MKATITILRGPRSKKIVLESNMLNSSPISVMRKLLDAEQTLNEHLPGLRFHISIDE